MKIIKYHKPIPPYYKLDSKGSHTSYKVSEESKLFYETFKKSFLNDEVITFGWKENEWPNLYDKYLNKLLKDLESNYFQHKDLNLFTQQYVNIKKYFDIHTRWDFYEYFVEFLISINEFEEAFKEWVRLREEEWEGWNKDFTFRDSELYSLIRFEGFLNKSLIDGYFINKIASKGNQLTKFGKRNIDAVHMVVTTLINESTKVSFFAQFYENYSTELDYYTKKRITFPLDYYEKYFQHNRVSKGNWKWLTQSPENLNIGKPILKNGRASSLVVISAIRNESSRLLREAENEYRIIIGAKKIGEGWISETELYYRIKIHFKDIEVIHHGRPKWLGRQHFDIWIPEMNVAIEYQGQQHDNPVEFFGGEEAFKKNIKRDLLKKKKCIENNCSLIEVRPGYNLDEVIKEINQSIGGDLKTV